MFGHYCQVVAVVGLEMVTIDWSTGSLESRVTLADHAHERDVPSGATVVPLSTSTRADAKRSAVIVVTSVVISPKGGIVGVHSSRWTAGASSPASTEFTKQVPSAFSAEGTSKALLWAFTGAASGVAEPSGRETPTRLLLGRKGTTELVVVVNSASGLQLQSVAGLQDPIETIGTQRQSSCIGKTVCPEHVAAVLTASGTTHLLQPWGAVETIPTAPASSDDAPREADVLADGSVATREPIEARVAESGAWLSLAARRAVGSTRWAVREDTKQAGEMEQERQMGPRAWAMVTVENACLWILDQGGLATQVHRTSCGGDAPRSSQLVETVTKALSELESWPALQRSAGGPRDEPPLEAAVRIFPFVLSRQDHSVTCRLLMVDRAHRMHLLHSAGRTWHREEGLSRVMDGLTTEGAPVRMWASKKKQEKHNMAGALDAASWGAPPATDEEEQVDNDPRLAAWARWRAQYQLVSGVVSHATAVVAKWVADPSALVVDVATALDLADHGDRGKQEDEENQRTSLESSLARDTTLEDRLWEFNTAASHGLDRTLVLLGSSPELSTVYRSGMSLAHPRETHPLKRARIWGLRQETGSLLWSRALPTTPNHADKVLESARIWEVRDSPWAEHAPLFLLAEVMVDTQRHETVTTLSWIDAWTGDVVETVTKPLRVSHVVQLPFRTTDDRAAYLALSSDHVVDASAPSLGFLVPDTPRVRQEWQKLQSSFVAHVRSSDGKGIVGLGVFSKEGPHRGTFELEQRWRVHVAPGDTVLQTVAPPTEHERSTQADEADPAVILGDDSLLLRYPSHHLLAVFSGRSDSATQCFWTVPARIPGDAADSRQPQQSPASKDAAVTVQLLDAVSGRVLHTSQHEHARGPVHATRLGAHIVYSLWNLDTGRPEIGTVALFSGAIGPFDLNPFSNPRAGMDRVSSWSMEDPTVLDDAYVPPKVCSIFFYLCFV